MGDSTKLIEIRRQEGLQLARVADLHKWADNPREYDKADLERLKRQIELGEHSTLLIMPDGTVLGGNTRLDAYHRTGKEFAKVIVVDVTQEGERWVAAVDGERAPKTFDSKQQAMLEYALSHNDQIGRYNDQKLAELLHVHPVEMELYKVPTYVKPVEDIAFEAGGAPPEERPEDEDTTKTDKLDAYMHGNIKQIVLYFDNEQYESVIPRIDALRNKYGAENNTELFLGLLDIAENEQ